MTKENRILLSVHTSAGRIVQLEENDHIEVGMVFEDDVEGITFRIDGKVISMNDDGRVFYRITEIDPPEEPVVENHELDLEVEEEPAEPEQVEEKEVEEVKDLGKTSRFSFFRK